MVRTATTDKLKKLYHWQPFVPGEESEERLIDSLVNRRIYCSSPRDFNDPWDCYPYFDSDIYKDQNERNKLSDWLADDVQKRSGSGLDSSSEIQINQIKQSFEKAEEFISKFFTPTFFDQYRVYCLGPDVENVLMWSHYADSHKGICFEFSVNNRLFCNALSCIYSDKYPIIKLHDNSDLQLVLAKSSVWEYEKEYRIIAQEACYGTDDIDIPRTNDGYLQIPDEALMSVIIGCRGNIQRVKELVRKHASQVSIKYAQQAANRYAVRIQEL